MITIGIDPDTKNTGIALVEHGMVTWVGTASAKGSIVQYRLVGMGVAIATQIDRLHECLCVNPSMIAIEWQMLRPTGEKNPNDILNLTGVAGMCVSACLSRFWTDPDYFTPVPVQWKGSVPKTIHQKRILGKVGLTADLKGVRGAEEMTKTQKGHCIDAIGLALWAAEQRVRRSS